MTIYCYLRISTTDQNFERQQLRFKDFTSQKGFEKTNLVWIRETVSGKRDWKERKLAHIINHAQAGDVFITDEISRIGRTSLEVQTVLYELLKKKIAVHIIEQGFEFNDDLTSQVYAFAFSIAAQIERELISSRTKAGLKATRAKGTVLGRPVGSKSKQRKLDQYEKEIREMTENRVSISAIARTLKCSRQTLRTWIKENLETKSASV